jgi:DNA-binding NarL/FixJ family response regulator
MKDNGMQMTSAERSAASVLIVETDAGERSNMRTALKNLDFGAIADAPNHLAALEKFNDRKFSHVIFDAKKTNYPMKEWLQKVFEICPGIIAIPTSSNPSIDDVFDLLVVGAKGYLVKPYTFESVDQAVMMATKGEPISDAVLNAKDRNEALVAIMMSSLDKFATIYRQSQQFETAKRELPRAMAMVKRSSDLAHTFAKGGADGLLEALEKFCLERSKGPASKLGRLRKRLNNTRAVDTASAD